MKQIYLPFFLLFLTITGFSQSDFRKGYVILNSGDTINGFLEYRGNKSNARKCVFEKNFQDPATRKEYTPEDLQAYRFFDSKYYISRKVKIGESEKLLFLEYLIKGKVDIFYYRDELGEHYLAQKDGGRLVPLTDEERMINVLNTEGQGYYDKHYLEESKKYIGVLKYLFQESPTISKSAENTSLTHKSLIKITKDYHNAVCKDEACIIYEKKEPKIFVYLGPVIGANLYFLSRVSNNFLPEKYYFADSKWKTSFNPSIGVSFSFNLPSLNERMYLQNDLMMTMGNSKTKTSYEDEGTGVIYDNDISYTRYSICNALVFKYEILSGNFRPEIIFGGFADLSFKTDYSRTLNETINALSLSSGSYNDSPFYPLVYGLTVGTGCVIYLHNNQKIFIDLKYASGLGIYPALNTNIVSLNVGIPFKL